MGETCQKRLALRHEMPCMKGEGVGAVNGASVRMLGRRVAAIQTAGLHSLKPARSVDCLHCHHSNELDCQNLHGLCEALFHACNPGCAVLDGCLHLFSRLELALILMHR